MNGEELRAKLEQIPENKRMLVGVVEALLVSSDEPMTIKKIREIVPDLLPREINAMIDYLNADFQHSSRAFDIQPVAGGYQIFTRPEYSTYIKALYQSKHKTRLTQKSLETLAIIAYNQPVTKHQLEEIRGVNVDGVMKTLLSRKLITIAGREQAPGSPFLYRTTPEFLHYFGLNALDDLPRLKEIDDLIETLDIDETNREAFIKEMAPGTLGLAENPADENIVDNGEIKNGEKQNPA